MRRQQKTRSTVIGVALLVFSLIAAGWTFYTVHTHSSMLGFADSSRAGAADSTTNATAGSPLAGAPGSPTASANSPDYSALSLSAKAVYLINADTGAVLFARDADAPRAPASTAKIVTALTVLNHARPEDVVTIAQSDVVDPTQESNMGLQVGDTVTVHDLLVGLFLPSGNDAANALARFAGERLSGSSQTPVQRFVAEMNVTAAKLGMKNSHFVNPSGDDVDGQVVTAHDLSIAARALLANPALQPIVSLPTADVRIGGPNARVVSLTNTNELVLTNGVYGVKTGTTDNAGECLIVAYRTQAENVIAVILGSEDRYADAGKLLGIQAPSGGS
ncbi:MAG TPA: D-alanyl-D-alanine carboxypeptidase [Nitrolancea sp.]|nr:D-alanyl-D-alanine carboxypeptidase [Nitrolancea sp.]